ncbi:MAG: alginate lyase family protein [Cyclobacteriaceae bacterium]
MQENRLLKVGLLAVLISGGLLAGCGSPKKKEQNTVAEKESPQKTLTNMSVSNLEYAKAQIQSGDPGYVEEYQKIIDEADEALNEGPFSVMNKTQVALSGDKHDYLSLAPYFWPDESKPDGLPWLRRDGEVNPLTRGENVDQPQVSRCFDNIGKLSIAYYFSGKKVYASKIIELLDTWFVNPDTKMNPHLNYAQGIPGQNDGRCFGIIEFGGIKSVVSAIEILKINDVIGEELENAMRTWLTQYLKWLRTSELGVMEKTRKNNHATHYDGQVVSMLLFLGREEEARRVLEEVKVRISSQIEKDGTQPHELARTKTLSYSTMNLQGFTQLAYYGQKVGVDLWNYKDEKGAGIQTAYEFLYPYAIGEKEWAYKQIKSVDMAIARLQRLFARAGSTFNNSRYCDVAQNRGVSIFYPCTD